MRGAGALAFGPHFAVVAVVKVDAQAHTCVQAMLKEGLHCWGLCGLRLDEALMCPVAGTTRSELRGRRRSGLTFHRACSTSTWGEALALCACGCDVWGRCLCARCWDACLLTVLCLVLLL